MRCLCLTLFAVLLTCHQQLALAEKPATIHRDLTYASVDKSELQLDLYLPKGVEKPPLLVWVHGGGWRGGSRKNPRLQSVLDDGFALASISYRFSETAIFPAQLHDCKSAIRWLRANEATYGYDSSWIAVAGSSAGGHLALMLGVTGDVEKLEGNVGRNLDQSSRVQAIIDYFGPSDFVLRGKTQPERAYTDKSGSYALLGGHIHGKPDKRTEQFASPAHYVTKDDPPLLVFHGTDDATVLLDQSERIKEVYGANGLDAELVVLKGLGHGGKEFFGGTRLEKAKQFLRDTYQARADHSSE